MWHTRYKQCVLLIQTRIDSVHMYENLCMFCAFDVVYFSHFMCERIFFSHSFVVCILVCSRIVVVRVTCSTVQFFLLAVVNFGPFHIMHFVVFRQHTNFMLV